MLFKIEGDDNKAILMALQEFQKNAEEEYRNELAGAKARVKAIQSVSPVHFDIPLPDELLILSYEENGAVFFRLGLYVPRIMRVLGRIRKMEKNLKEFLAEKGLKNFKVKWIEEENA
jgi:hypothetical protein